MILQALCNYYDRMEDAPGYGYAETNVSGCIILQPDGSISNIVSYAEGKQKSRPIMTPQQPKRTSGIRAAFLCDNAGYLLGVGEKNGAEKRSASAKLHHEILDKTAHEEVSTVLAFFDSNPVWTDEAVPSGNLVFRIEGMEGFVHDSPIIKESWEKYVARESTEGSFAQCLVTGEEARVARLHGNLPGFGQDKPTLVSFNKDSFVSFRKDQGDNAPVSELAAFKYVTALSALINDIRHVFRLGSDKVVFWAERKAELEEDLFGELISIGGLDSISSDRIKKMLESILTGRIPGEIDSGIMFYLLGISSNRTRMVLRFFYRDTFGHILESYIQHLSDIEIIPDSRGKSFASPIEILLETAVEHKYDNIPPQLESSLLRSIFWNTIYPYSLYMSILNRIRAEARVNQVRAGMLKGYINRNNRMNNRKEMVTVGLNPEDKNQGYLLGRMFALFEKAQYAALGKVNATVVDKYLNSALATPQAVFPMMSTMFEKHISKSEKYYLKKWMSEIIDMMPSSGYPQTLSAEDQGRFILGYYHQRYYKTNEYGDVDYLDKVGAEIEESNSISGGVK